MDTINFELKKRKIVVFFSKLLVPVTILSTSIYILWRTFFTLPFEHGVVAITLGLFLLIVEIVGMFEAATHFYSMTDIVSPKKPEDVDEKLFPDVDVFIATYNEPEELLYKTINGCVHMDYPDKTKVHIYICDDGNRQSIKELAEKMNVNYVTRTEHKHAKAGNLNNAMSVSSSPLIVTLDADMIPMSDFLTSCVPYFLTEEKIGFVQTPQAFYNLDLYQYYLYSEDRIPNEQDYFYKTVQTSRNKTNTVIYGGSNTVILREALDEIGGFVTDVITEDFATGMAIQSNGYKCIAIEDVHASGLSPEDLKSLIKQRERWARGCIQSGRKLNILFRKGLSWKQKLSYISSITYWYSSFKRLAYIISPIAFALFGVVVVECTPAELLVFWLPMYVLNKVAIRHLSGNIRSSKWSNVYETILFPALLPVVLIETFGMSKKTFAVTRKDGVIENDRQYQIRQLIPHVIFGVLTFLSIMSCLASIFMNSSVHYLFIMYWLLINFYNILMSIFFMMARKDYPEEKVAMAGVFCNIILEGTEFRCITNSISEKQFSFTMDFPKYFIYDKEVDVTLSSKKYTSSFKGKILDVSTLKSGFRYNLEISKIEESENRKLLQLIYDREPTLVTTLDVNISSFDDIRLNLMKRLEEEVVYHNSRNLPRVAVNRNFKTSEGKIIKLIDFNYEYIAISHKKGETSSGFNIEIGAGIKLECVYERTFFDRKRANRGVMLLYKVLNYKNISNTPALESIINTWIVENNRAQEELKKKEIETGRKGVKSDEFDEMIHL